MLSRTHRLSDKKDFQKVFLRGKSASTPYYAVRWHSNEMGSPRFGFVVSNKISKLATKRNTVRRRLREAVRKNLDPTFPPLDVVFIARSALLTIPYRELEPTVVRTLEIVKKRR